MAPPQDGIGAREHERPQQRRDVTGVVLEIGIVNQRDIAVHAIEAGPHGGALPAIRVGPYADHPPRPPDPPARPAPTPAPPCTGRRARTMPRARSAASARSSNRSAPSD